MPCQFNRLGISFQYPENWTLDEEDTLAEKPSVTVYSPGGAFWSVSVHPRSADPARLAKAVVEAMSAEYEDLDSEAAHETVGGRSLLGYDLTFFFLDFTNTVAIRCVQTERATLVVFCQAEDHEYDAVRRVFLAMTTSLLDGGSG